MERKQQPIGFFDSGVGGLSVLRHAREMLPNENFIFYGDCGNVPYGEKTPEQVRMLTLAVMPGSIPSALWRVTVAV